MRALAGRTAVVTGGSRRFGRGIVEARADLGRDTIGAFARQRGVTTEKIGSFRITAHGAEPMGEG